MIFEKLGKYFLWVGAPRGAWAKILGVAEIGLGTSLTGPMGAK